MLGCDDSLLDPHMISDEPLAQRVVFGDEVRCRRNPSGAAPGRVKRTLGGMPPRQKGDGPIFRRGRLCDVVLVGRAARFDISNGEHEHERLQENPRRNRRRRHARRNRPLPRLPPDITTATATADTAAGMATASPPTATTAIPPTAAIPLTATATSPTATATAAAEGWLVARAGVVGYRPCVSCGRIRSAAPRRSSRRGAILFMRAKSRA